MDHAIVVVSEKSSPYPKSSRLSPMLSSRRFVVLHFTFMFVIHFKLIFVKGLRSVSSFVLFFCMWTSSCTSSNIVEETISAPLYSLCSFVEYQLTIFMWVCFGAVYSVLLIYYCNTIVSLEVG